VKLIDIYCFGQVITDYCPEDSLINNIYCLGQVITVYCPGDGLINKIIIV